MSNGQIVAALVLGVFFIYCGRVVLAFMNFQYDSFDEQDKRVSQLKNDRKSKGLCIYCGEKLTNEQGVVCNSCAPDIIYYGP
jgi:hypothetical protein